MGTMYETAKSPDSREAIAERLRLTREALGLTITEWAERVGISRNAWSNYEGGARRISLDEAFKIARTMNIPLDWLYRGQTHGLPHEVVEGLRRLRQERDDQRLSA